MAASLTVADINDLIIATRPRETLGKLVDIASRLTEYVFVRYMAKENKVLYDGGTSIRGDLIYDHNFSAAMVGLHEVIEVSIPDVLTRFDVPWRHSNHNWGYERREMLINRQNATLSQIVNVIDTRRIAAKISEAELLETQFWTNVPDVTNSRDIYGLRYWIQLATSGRGFNGTVPSGYSDVAGLNPTTYTRWKNYNAIYTDVTEDDLLTEMNLAADETSFVPPVDMEEFKSGVGKQNMIAVNLTTKQALESELRRRNDIHTDLARFAGATAFRNTPIRYVPKLNVHSQNPVYMLNLDYFFVAALTGDNSYEHEPLRHPSQPNTWVVHVDSSFNTICTSRRRQAVINKAA